MKISDLLNELALVDAGWLRVEGPAGIALLPTVAQDQSEWEKRSIAMHKAQQTVELERKPDEPSRNVKVTHVLNIITV